MTHKHHSAKTVMSLIQRMEEIGVRLSDLGDDEWKKVLHEEAVICCAFTSKPSDDFIEKKITLIEQ